MKQSKNDAILDSKLIIATTPKLYNVKLVDCGLYKQVYYYKNAKVKRPNKKDNTDLDLSKITLNNDSLLDKKEKQLKTKNEIQDRNLIRSKLQCQRIAKSNMEDWKSFITLTFEENIIEVKKAWKKLHSFITMVQKNFSNFKYLCVPEFQKRGAVHYHLLTNIPCNSKIIPKRKLKRLYNPNIKDYKDLEYYDIKYWSHGFSSAEPLENDAKKVVGYISKYMTKDIDNRLFNHRRYFYSRNVEVPKVSYINSSNDKDYEYLIKKIQDKEVIYQNEYINSYDNSQVSFLEFQ